MKLNLSILFFFAFITAQGQEIINVAPATSSTKNKAVYTKVGTDNKLAFNSAADQLFAENLSKGVLSSASFNNAALNKRIDSLVLAFNNYKLQTDKALLTIPILDSLNVNGNGVKMIKVGNNSYNIQVQVYYDWVSKTFKANW